MSRSNHVIQRCDKNYCHELKLEGDIMQYIPHVRICIPMIAISFILLGCASYIERQGPVEQTQEDRYAQKAEEYAETYKITDYKYVGIEMFKPYVTSGKHIMVDRGMNIYNEKGNDVFSDKYIGVNKEGITIAVTGIESFRERKKAKDFLSKVVAALHLSYPFLRENDNSMEDYSVWFLPKAKYVEWYISHEKSSEYSMRDYQVGYKSTYWYFGNRMADDKLQFLSISLKESKGLYIVAFHVESNEASSIAASVRKDEINDISKKVLH